MSEKFTVEIITPESSILKLDTSEVLIPSYVGYMGILQDHIPLITFSFERKDLSGLTISILNS